jgi:ribonuclease D
VNLTSFYQKILENKQIMKIFHAPSEDIRLFQSLKCFPVNVFDTERCAKLLNYPKPSLEYLLDDLLKVKIDKSNQLSNWLLRPLTSSQIQYARYDVKYLIALKRKLLEKADIKGIRSWVDQENKDWDTVRYDSPVDPEFIKYTDHLTIYQAHISISLLKLRENYAAKLNKPPHHIFPKDIVIKFIQNVDNENVFELHNMKGVHYMFKSNRTISQLFNEAFIAAKQEADQLNLSKEDRFYSKKDEKFLFPPKSALDISKNCSYNVAFSNKSFEEKLEYYNAIKNKFCKVYGIHTAEYVFNPRIIRKLCHDPNYFAGLNLPYKQEMLHKFTLT